MPAGPAAILWRELVNELMGTIYSGQLHRELCQSCQSLPSVDEIPYRPAPVIDQPASGVLRTLLMLQQM